MSDYGCSKGRNEYFNFRTGACHDNEKVLYGKLLGEYISQKGVKCIFFPTDWNPEYDKIFGEDMDRSILRRFSFKAFFEIPEEIDEFSKFGIFGTDVFVMYVPITYFEDKSKLAWDKLNLNCDGSGDYESLVPKVGDLVETNYGDNALYEVINVKKTSYRFQQTQHVYSLTVRVFRDDNLSFDAMTSATMTDTMLSAVDVPDILDISSYIDEQSSGVNYNPSVGEQPPQDPFGGW